MELTLNEMRALKRFAELALSDTDQSANIDELSEIADRWEVLEAYLKEHRIGVEYTNGKYSFRSPRHINSLIARLSDLIADEERKQKDASKMAWAAWFFALATAVSSAAALVALCS